MKNKEQIDQLNKKLDLLLEKNQNFAKEIDQLKVEIFRLRYTKPDSPTEPNIKSTPPIPPKKKEENVKIVERRINPQERLIHKKDTLSKETKKEKVEKTEKSSEFLSSDLEKFIGENLISKIGILITIVGVGIGAKYSIENELVSPLTRIISGYLMGLGLLGFGIKLKETYTNYSAVLVSGSIAILYFITFAGYSFYGLFPQLFAFGLMVILTIFTVVAAIHYNKSIIAHIGLIGAYAVPFLLSTGSGNVSTLFSYMVIINVGILLIAFKKYWEKLYYTASGLTWLIYTTWFFQDFRAAENFGTAMIFAIIFFVIFYAIFLAYKIKQSDKIEITDTVLILFNAFVFYGFGYYILESHPTGQQLLGVFTLGNALIHFVVSFFIYQKKLGSKNLLYLLSGLVLVFITAAIPVQLDGNWVTILWAAEAAVLFWVARTRAIPIYEKISYPIMFLAFCSLLEDWNLAYPHYIQASAELVTPLLNVHFLSSLLFIGAFGFINYINQNKNFKSPFEKDIGVIQLINYAISAISIFVIYSAFKNEISLYWNQLSAMSELNLDSDSSSYRKHIRNNNLKLFKNIWIINYSILFAILLSSFNLLKLKNRQLGKLNLILKAIALLAFLGPGLLILSNLRENYLNQTQAEYYSISQFNLWIRYLSFIFVGVLLFTFYKFRQKMFFGKIFKMGFDFILFGSILWIASSELIHWMDIRSSAKSYKIELSIFWGVYSLILVILGIWKRKKHLRVGGITLFGMTLFKLLMYDLAHLDTISKTIVLVSLGVLLLIISFLYNKYTLKISAEDEN